MKATQKVRAVKEEMDKIIAGLIKCGISDDNNFPVVRERGKENGFEVTFDGAEHVSIALGDIEYTELHRELREKRSYNMKLLDGGLVQLMYYFENDLPIRHRLAYYPSPDLHPFRENPDAYMRDDLFVEIISRRIVPFPLRFDFDGRKEVYKDTTHPKSHLTLGDVKLCRIPVSSPLTPRWFIEFILRNFYQTEDHDFVSDLPNHRFNFVESISNNERNLIHLVIPTGVAE